MHAVTRLHRLNSKEMLAQTAEKSDDLIKVAEPAVNFLDLANNFFSISSLRLEAQIGFEIRPGRPIPLQLQ